jgi:hypothetical protein
VCVVVGDVVLACLVRTVVCVVVGDVVLACLVRTAVCVVVGSREFCRREGRRREKILAAVNRNPGTSVFVIVESVSEPFSVRKGMRKHSRSVK